MSRLLFRSAAVLIALLDVGHSFGYPWSDPAWGVDLHAVQTSHFNLLGFSRTYWDFYLGFGISVSVFLLLASVLAWQLGSVSVGAFPAVRLTQWLLVFCFAAITLLDCVFFFIIPIVLSGLITVCLGAAASISADSPGAKLVGNRS